MVRMCCSCMPYAEHTMLKHNRLTCLQHPLPPIPCMIQRWLKPDGQDLLHMHV
jgi:hypothetical protein